MYSSKSDKEEVIVKPNMRSLHQNLPTDVVVQEASFPRRQPRRRSLTVMRKNVLVLRGVSFSSADLSTLLFVLFLAPCHLPPPGNSPTLIYIFPSDDFPSLWSPLLGFSSSFVLDVLPVGCSAAPRVDEWKNKPALLH